MLPVWVFGLQFINPNKEFAVTPSQANSTASLFLPINLSASPIPRLAKNAKICTSANQHKHKLEDVNLSEGNLKDVAETLFDEFYLNDVPESVRAYIDYEKYARDCEMGGDLYEFDFEGTTWTCTNASSI
ncbi:MAG: hypothetical protein NVSMB70_07450 [Chamaesiphon sp.]